MTTVSWPGSFRMCTAIVARSGGVGRTPPAREDDDEGQEAGMAEVKGAQSPAA